jgi:N-formylmaleamate deformylase
MDGWDTGDVRVNGVRLRYHRSGGALPPVVLVHGLTDHSWYWLALARALAPAYDVVLYDARGHGESDRSPQDYTLAVLADDLVALREALQLEHPAVIGHSMGGSTASVAAAGHPGLFRCLVLEDPVWPDPARAWNPAALIPSWHADLLANQGTPREARIARQREAAPGWTEEDYGLWADSKAAVRPEALDVLASFARPWVDDARRIDCPLLVLTGEPKRGAIVDEAAEAALRTARPDVRLVRLSGTGHQVRRERFAAYRDEVMRFLAHPLPYQTRRSM